MNEGPLCSSAVLLCSSEGLLACLLRQQRRPMAIVCCAVKDAGDVLQGSSVYDVMYDVV